MTKCWVSVALARPLMGLFDYECATTVEAGVRVRVPFGNQELIGLVMVVNFHAPSVNFPIKSVIEILDSKAIVSDSVLSLLNFAANYYQHPLGEVVHAALPKILRDGGHNSRQLTPYYSLTPTGKSVLDNYQSEASKGHKLGKKQQQVLQLLSDGEKSYDALKDVIKLTPTWLAELVARGWLAQQNKFFTPNVEQQPALSLSDEQKLVLKALAAHNAFTVSVLDGVTGSGKTEVYIRYIERLCANGGQVLLLVPEIGLVQTMLKRLRARLTMIVVAHHSGMSDKQRLESWQAIAVGDAHVLVGTRSAVFNEFAQLSGIIVDEEHDPAYKQQDGFRYNARDLAIVRAKHTDVPILLGSATPLVESYHQIRSGKWQHLPMLKRVGNQPMPQVCIENTERATMINGLSVGLIRAMRQALANDEQVLLFLNRRGYAPMLRCEKCGWQSDCEACDAVMTAHTASRALICHHCGRKQGLPTVCPACHENALVMIGLGTQKLEQSVRSQFPTARIMRIDSDAFTTAKQFEQALSAVENREVDIVLGTQWLAKGHHFSRLNLVAIIDADQALYSVDFRSEERLAQLLVQVSGRAGRETKGRVWVQTKQPTHPVFKSLTAPYSEQLKRLYNERIEAQLPPCSAQALLFARHKELSRAMNTLEMAKLGAQQAGIATDWLWLGPAPALIARKDGQHRAQLLLQAPNKQIMHQQLHLVNQWLLAQGKANGVRCGMDVDPLWLE